MNLRQFIEGIESRHFRTASDTGANPNALFVWNILREHAGLPRLTRDDLMQKHADEIGMTIEEMREDRRSLDAYLKWQRDTGILREYGVPQEYWPKNPFSEGV